MTNQPRLETSRSGIFQAALTAAADDDADDDDHARDDREDDEKEMRARDDRRRARRWKRCERGDGGFRRIHRASAVVLRYRGDDEVRHDLGDVRSLGDHV